MLTIALDRYDRHLPIFSGQVKLDDGTEYRALEVGMVPPRDDGVDRHRRMLTDLEFDVAEVSLCSYIMAKRRGVPLTAVPVFPRRLFSQNHIYVSKRSGIRAPADLVGKRVGLWAFQVTMSVLAKGDLKSEYGAPWEKIHWVTDAAEEIAWKGGSGFSIQRTPAGKNIADMLIDGELDAYIYPHPPYSIQTRTDRVERLFSDPKQEALRYFAKRAYYPIMHLLALKEERVKENPALPQLIMKMWEDSKRLSHDFYHDPGYSLLAFARNEYEEQAKVMGEDPWSSGLRPNRRNLEDFIGYMVDQRLLDSPMNVEQLFHESTLGT